MSIRSSASIEVKLHTYKGDISYEPFTTGV